VSIDILYEKPNVFYTNAQKNTPEKRVFLKKDSKIVKGKYYNNEYYGIFSIFSRDDLSNIISGDGDY